MFPATTEMTREDAIAKADRLAILGIGPIYVFDNGREAWTAGRNTRGLWSDLTPIYVAK